MKRLCARRERRRQSGHRAVRRVDDSSKLTCCAETVTVSRWKVAQWGKTFEKKEAGRTRKLPELTRSADGLPPLILYHLSAHHVAPHLAKTHFYVGVDRLWRYRIVQLGGEQEARHQPHPERTTGVAQASSSKAAIAYEHQLSLWIPSSKERNQNLRIGWHGAMGFAKFGAERRSARRYRKDRQRPRFCAPRKRNQYHQAKPVDAFRRERMAWLGTYRIMVAPFVENMPSPPPLLRPVNEEYQCSVRSQPGGDDTLQENATQVQWRPHISIEDAMIGREMAIML